MRVEYEEIEGRPGLLKRIDRQRAAETECYGCGQDYGHRWPHGQLLALICDRSGSEQAHCHVRTECIDAAIERLEEDED